MAVHIRLARAGAKKKPFYRLVVTDHRSPRGGRFLENIGTFDPSAKSANGEEAGVFTFDQARLEHWTKNGAVASDTVKRLLKRARQAGEAAAKN